VLLVPTTQPETIEQYGIRVAEAWKLGRKGVDDGALLLVAKDDRALRIEVGYGLEGAVPDAIAKRIVEETITPRFREGDFYGGVSAGVDQLMHVIDGEPLPEPRGRRARAPGSESLFVLAAIVLFGSHFLGRLIGEAPSAFAAGGLYGAVAGWILGSLAFGALAGVALFAFSLISQLGGHGGGGGWSTGGHGGSLRGGGFRGGGGGFSGGGGGFGGGGASGRW
jgi:uncharacterized protein